MYFLGIDVSTTGSKAVIMDTEGSVVATAVHDHDLSTPRPLWAEQNPDDWWTASTASIRDVLNEVDAAEITAIGLTGQMLGLVCLGADLHPLRPSILWNDNRSGAECDTIYDTLGADFVHDHLGSMMIPGIMIPKLLWVRDHEPDVYRQIRHILLPKDYVRLKLSGTLATDVAGGSGTGLLDIRERKWSEKMLDALDVPRDWLPELVESPEVCATVSDEAAAQTGLRAGTPIVGGAGDQPAQAVSMGIITNGATNLTVGTSGVCLTAADRYAPDPDGRGHTWCHAVPGHWCLMGVMQSAAGSLRWLHDAIAANETYDDLTAAVADVPVGSLGLVFAPYLSGERHPHPDPLARGAYVGLTLRTERAQMVRATMEGVAFGLRDLVELARAQGVNPPSAAISGGAVRSAVWRQIITDVMGFPLYTVDAEEGAAYGAAILASVGGGAYDTVEAACTAMVKRLDETQPNVTDSPRYNELYAIFREVYPALKDVFAKLSRFDEQQA